MVLGRPTVRFGGDEEVVPPQRAKVGEEAFDEGEVVLRGLRVAFGRIVGSETGRPNLLIHLASWQCVVG